VTKENIKGVEMEVQGRVVVDKSIMPARKIKVSVIDERQHVGREMRYARQLDKVLPQYSVWNHPLTPVVMTFHDSDLGIPKPT
jgi:hypothetical protein